MVGTLNRQGKSTEAEPLAREALAIREKVYEPGRYPLASARLTLGAALLGQKRYAEAEPLLLSALEDMKRIEADQGLTVGEKAGMTALVERLAQLYEATNRPEKAAALKQ